MRRTTHSLLILVLLWAQTGLPLPAELPWLSHFMADEDFPCKYHQCGCTSAEQCRTQCCCVKSIEARQEKAPAPKPTSSCCSATPKRTNEPTTEPESEDATATGILILQALKCQGLDHHGLMRWTMVVPAETALLPASEQVESIWADLLTTPESLPLAPTSPPPRLRPV